MANTVRNSYKYISIHLPSNIKWVNFNYETEWVVVGLFGVIFFISTLELCDEYVKAKSQRRNLTIYEIHLIQKAAKQQQP